MILKAKIIALILSVSVCIVTWASDDANEHGNDINRDGLKAWNFSEYFVHKEPNIEPNAPGYVLPLDLKPEF